MATTEYLKANKKQTLVRFNNVEDAAVIEWLDRQKEEKVSWNLIMRCAVTEFMEKHEFDDPEFLKEYLSRKCK